MHENAKIFLYDQKKKNMFSLKRKGYERLILSKVMQKIKNKIVSLSNHMNGYSAYMMY